MSDTKESAALALNEAAISGDIDCAKVALGFDADIHYNHDMALRSAAKNARLPMIEFLVKQGADIHALSDEPLRAAAKNGREVVVKKLLELGANPDAQDGEPLINAATKGLTGVVRELLAHHANPHFSDDHALRQAAYNGHYQIVKELAENKADLFSLRGSAAHLAASEKHTDVVAYLTAQMAQQRNAFVEALSQSTVREFLRRDYGDTGETGFVRAVKMNCIDKAVARMKEQGDVLTPADLSLIKDRGGRPLGVVAAESGNLGALFDIDLWHGTLADVQGAWNAIPPLVRKSGGATEEDFAGIIAGFNQRQLKEKAGKVKLKF
jgi:hypothetical protein